MSDYGDTSWSRVEENPGYEYYGSGIIELRDGNILVWSTLLENSTNEAWIDLQKINPGGDTLWGSRQISYLPGWTTANSCIETRDGGFLFTGYWDKPSSFTQLYLCKTDSLGRKEWDRVYGGASTDVGYGVAETNSGYLVVGYSGSFGTRNLYLLRTDIYGSLQWQKYFGGLYDDAGLGIISSLDGNYYLIGYRSIDDSANSQSNLNYVRGWLLKVTGDGVKIWEKTYGSSNIGGEFGKILQLPDSNLAISGVLLYDVDYNYRGWLLKVNKIGSELWSREYSWSVPYAGEGHDYFWDFSATSDGGFIMGGQVTKGPSGNQDAWLVKVDSMGCLAPGCDTICYPFMKPRAEIRRGYRWDPYEDTIYLPQGHSGWVNFWCGDPLGKTLYWDFGDGEKDTVLKPLHRYKPAGTFIVTLIVENGPCRDTGTVTVIHGWPTGMDTKDEGVSLRVWPNPVIDASLFIEAEGNTVSSEAVFTLYDIIGRVVFEEKIPVPVRLEISTAGLNSSMYFYVMVSDGVLLARGKVVVQ